MYEATSLGRLLMVKKIGEHELITSNGSFTLTGFVFGEDQQLIFALWRLPPAESDTDIFLRVQYGCMNGTVFKAIDCDCGQQVDASLRRISENGAGVFIYFPGHEALGFGAVVKMRIVELEKRAGIGFFDAIHALGLAGPGVDVLWTVPHVLHEIGVTEPVVLLGKHLDKSTRLQEIGIPIRRIEDL